MASQAEVKPEVAVLPLGDIEQESAAVLSVGQLMWMRFRKNKPAVIGGIFLIIMYLVMIFSGFISPYGVSETHQKYPGAAPSKVRFVDVAGGFHIQPFVYGYDRKVDLKTFKPTFSEDTSKFYQIKLFVKGTPYDILGIFKWDIHLFGVDEPGKVFLLGTDTNGRDLFTRILYGSRVSLSVGLVGVLLSLVIGTVLGVAAGFYGGLFDMVLQRLIEVLQSFPQIPLWLALASAVPVNWDPIKVYFGITIVLSVVNWGGLARQVRGKVLSLREATYVTAARYTNCSDWRIITRHLLPNTLSHVLVVATLSIPGMILGETALSFLGLGIRPPMVSWGVLMSDMQSLRVFLTQPWLITPAIFVVSTIIAYNFLGDGIRDAADPFSS
jgi:peptide/nickel transport system permease protein